MSVRCEGLIALGIFLFGFCWMAASDASDGDPLSITGGLNCNSQGELYYGEQCTGGYACYSESTKECNQGQGWKSKMCQKNAGENGCPVGCDANNNDELTTGPDPNNPNQNPCTGNYS